MPPVVIENPILNSPFKEPSRHFRFSEDGITDQAVDGRRESGYFLPKVEDATLTAARELLTETGSIFVRHAYFTGTDEPYEKLKRALRAEIDEAAWASLCSTVSRPFAVPETGRIAVKVINHYGDKVLKVYET